MRMTIVGTDFYNLPLMPVTFSRLHDRLQRRLFSVGLAIGCHQRIDRSWCIRKRQIPVCARCLGILIGPFLTPFFLYFPKPWVAVACVFLFLMDACTQFIGARESNNWLRLATGAMFSASILFLLAYGVVAACLLNTRL